MKVLVIPDVHGSTHWKKNFTDHIDEVDKCIYLGDYYDSFLPEQKGEAAAKNLEDIISTTEPYKNKVKLLLGNHDISYLYQLRGSPHVSGHQLRMTYRYSNIIINHLDRFDIAVKIDDWVFSHAGFTKTWYRNTKTRYDIMRGEIKIPKGPVRFSNWMLHTDKDLRMLNFSDHCWDPSGDSVQSPPTWIRPRSLFSDMYYPNQVVGHTEVAGNKPLLMRAKNKQLIICDSQSHSTFFILDTKKALDENDFYSYHL